MRKYIYIFLFILLGSLSTHAHHANALDIETVRFGIHPEKTRMVLDISEITDFRVFALSSPYRIVIDLPTFQWNAGKIEHNSKAMITDIRQGKMNADISRIVFDMNNPVVINTAFILPKQGSKPNRLVIDYKTATESQFKKHKSTIHGTLSAEEYDGRTTQQSAPTPPANEYRPHHKTAEKPLIIIDPGHGGVDPGALGPAKFHEKNVVLALGKELKRQLLATGRYRVLMTREKDVFIRLKNRVKFARKHGGDLFISIHADTIHKSHVRGSSIYTLSKKSSDAQTAKLAEKENRADLIAGIDLKVEDEQVAFILGDFLMNDTMNQSKFFANTLVQKLQSHKIKTLVNPHRYAGFAVLKAPDIPSILIEAGFMSNKQEAKLLSQSGHRKKIASAIRSGIDSYFNQVRKNERN